MRLHTPHGLIWLKGRGLFPSLRVFPRTSLLCVFFLLSFLSTPCWAGGLYITEFGTPSTGVANAGAGAIAIDSSTAWHNPAGMTRLSGTHAQAAAGYLTGRIKFDTDSDTPVSGGDGGNASDGAPVLNSSVVYSLTDKLKLGFAVGSIAAAGLDYGNNWAGRQDATKVELLTLTGIPSVAYKLNWLSVGVGLTINYGNLDPFKLEAPNPAGTTIKLDGDDWAFGFLGGVLVEFNEHSRLGVMYRSKTEYDFSGDLKTSGGNLGGIRVNSKAEIIFPQLVEVHFYHELNDQFAIVAQADWEDWSAFEEIPISTSTGGGGAIPRNWDDTYKLGAGVRYRPSNPWLLMTGFAWDSNPVDTKDRTADMPMDRQLRYSAGAQYQWNERLNLGGNFTYLDLGKAKINNNHLKGEYKNNELYFFFLNASYKF